MVILVDVSIMSADFFIGVNLGFILGATMITILVLISMYMQKTNGAR